jgi:hypothetical protein
MEKWKEKVVWRRREEMGSVINERGETFWRGGRGGIE